MEKKMLYKYINERLYPGQKHIHVIMYTIT